MNQKDFSTTIVVTQTPEQVFKAINNPCDWWAGEIEGDSSKLNDEFSYRYKEIHYSKQRVIEMIPNRKVVWLITESNLNFTKDPSEWTGTKVSFEIVDKDGETELRFSHLGLIPEVECFDACSGAWTQLIQQGLFSLITKGESAQISLG
ncbi:SRPBCC family protein [Arachidicoccus soli]|uniref:SRPBCC domain-containing protein n=1 Tax=Arachidicoccus soli TaxID=2341117 RepID=A0A386HTA2_9BACT|nr:SRPBCC domain-containing protein [Arachidicoccus soli]AYD48889.1 SRPBCC domain-containing protein [Arachidicoccus soli]